jgi:hypothetical protein
VVEWQEFNGKSTKGYGMRWIVTFSPIYLIGVGLALTLRCFPDKKEPPNAVVLIVLVAMLASFGWALYRTMGLVPAEGVMPILQLAGICVICALLFILGVFSVIASRMLYMGITQRKTTS